MPDISQEEYDSLQRERDAAIKRREKEEKEAAEWAAANPPTHSLQLATGRWVEGNAVATHHSYTDDDGNDVRVPVIGRFLLTQEAS